MLPSMRSVGFSAKVTFGGKNKKAAEEPAAYVPEPRVVVKEVPVEVVREVIREVPVEVVKEKVVVSEAVSEIYVTDLNFDLGKTELRPEESFKLGRMCQVLKENPSAKVVLTGYADTATGTPEINRELAAKRSATVASRLKAEGIAASRISYTSAEGDWNASASPEANRRVTVRIVND
jgi:outer membrane protein OmpA-like peptidoglycan-associated protein